MNQPSVIVTRRIARFADTRWTLVMTAVQGDRAVVRRALLELCMQYWYPVYTYLRHGGHAPAIAEDISIAFFEDLLHSPVLLAATPAQGRFRDFLLAALRRFLALDWREMEETGGSDAPLAPPDPGALEERYLHEPTSLRPDHAFHRGYALDLIANAHRRLHGEAARAGRGEMFEALAPYLHADPETDRLDCVAEQLRTRPLMLLLALQRLRQRFRELIEEEIAQTVGSDAEHELERSMLMAILH